MYNFVSDKPKLFLRLGRKIEEQSIKVNFNFLFLTFCNNLVKSVRSSREVLRKTDLLNSPLEKTKS